jgi:chloramphenicol-sensitive protein RarD
MPISIIYLLFISDGSYIVSAKNTEYLYVILSGVVTITPLVFFTKAAKDLALNTLGLIQYISPLTQFVVGVFIYQEVLSTNKTISFILIWISCMMILINQHYKARSPK